MTDLFFWKKWHWELRFPYLILLVLLLVAVALGVYYYFTGFDNTIRWEELTSLQTVDVLVKPFYVLLKEFGTDLNGYLITDRFDASLPEIDVKAAVFYGAILGICLVFFLTIITTAKRILYFAGILLLMLLLASMNLDGLGIFGDTGNYLLLLSFGILGISSYALFAFFPNLSFFNRLLVNALTVSALASFIITQSSLSPSETVLHLVNYASSAGFIIGLIFLVFIAYENIHLILWFNTQASTQQKRFGFWPFFFISLLYLLNLLLLFFKNAYLFDFGLIYIDAFLIFIISVITGYWGLSRRASHYQKVFPFAPTAAYLYLIFAVLTVLNIAYAFATANDPVIAAYDSMIIMIHLAFGFMFFVYVVANFGRLLTQKLPVHRIVYDPKRIPFFTVYVMGALLLLALLFRSNFMVYNQVLAGYYNYIGDFYKVSGDDLLAERFYEEGAVYEHFNVKSNYALASINRERQYVNTEINYLKEALRLRPTEKVFARLANMYTSKELFFEQMYVLQQALDSFPNSAELNNNLAQLYNQSDIIDSTAYYLAIAEEKGGKNKEIIQSNLLAFYIKYGQPKEALELAENQSSNSTKSFQNNKTLLNLLLGNKAAYPLYLPESNTLTNREFGLLYNSLLQHVTEADSTTIKLLSNLIKQPQNQLFSEDLTLLKALVQHYNNYPNAAKTTLVNLSAYSENSGGYYMDVLGNWMLERGLYREAADNFRKAAEIGYSPALVHHAYALALAERPIEAQRAINRIYETNDVEMVNEALAVSDLIGLESAAILEQASDTVRVQYITVNHRNLTEIELNHLVNSIKNPEIKIIAQKQYARILTDREQYSKAQKLLNQVKPKLPENSEILSQVNLLQARIWLKTNNLKAITDQLNTLYIAEDDQPQTFLYKGILAEKKNQPEKAKQLYDSLLLTALYQEEGIIAAAEFYNKQKTPMKAYETLLAGVTYNPFSAELLKAYTLQSARLRLEGFAAYGIEQLSTLLPEEEYATFKQRYEQVREASAVKENSWK